MNFKQPVLYFLLVYAIGACSTGLISQQYDVEEYYWRDYNGEIPSDAVPGGEDKDGRTTYIGQVIHSEIKTALHPGQIRPVYKNISYAFGGKPYVATKFIKILCSSQPERLHWITTNTQDLRYMLPQKQFVVGGDLDDYPLLIGLASRKDQAIVGKVTIRLGLEAIGFVENNVAIYEDFYRVLAFDGLCDA